MRCPYDFKSMTQRINLQTLKPIKHNPLNIP